MKLLPKKQTNRLRLMLLLASILAQTMMVCAETFTVTECGQLKVRIESMSNSNKEGVTDLNVIGPLDTDDLNALSKLKNLETLDLYQAVFPTMTGCMNLTKLTSVILPDQVEEIGTDAFRNCKKLHSVTLRSVHTIGDSAFNGCEELSNITLPASLKVIGYQAFYNAALATVIIPENIEKLGQSCFYCENLKTVYLPSSLKELKSLFWYGGRNLKEVYFKGTCPLSTESFSQAQGTLYVPECTIAAFKSDSNWNKFSHIKAYPSYLASEINIPFTHTDVWGGFGTFYYDLTTEGLAQGAVINNHGNLKVEGQTSVCLSTYHQSFGTSYLDGTPTMIVNAPLTALHAELVHCCYSEIGFFSSPFDIKIKDIRLGNRTHLVVREYDAKRRAALRKDVWKTLGPNDVMKAGKGYVLFTDVEDDNEEGSFIFSGDPSTGNLFSKEDVVVKLDSWPSELPHAANWNLVANPYPCYFSINDIEHDGLLTVWNGYRYMAYSGKDDTGYLKPFKAFFVQRTSSPEITFRASGRYRDTEGKRNAPMPTTEADRKVFNFLMYKNDGEDIWDRARIVSNPDANIGYDLKCDAPKFDRMDDSAFEIYVNSDGMKMSIDERPELDGRAVLGVFIPKEGEYRISLDTRYKESLILHDLIADETVLLDQDDYVFSSEAGDFPERFIVHFGKKTRIDEMNDEDYTLPEVFSLDGIKVGSGKAVDLNLDPGIYIERDGKNSRKITIR